MIVSQEFVELGERPAGAMGDVGNSGWMQRQIRQHFRASRSSIQMKTVLQRDRCDTVQKPGGEQSAGKSGQREAGDRAQMVWNSSQMVWKSAKVVWDRADGGGDMWLSGLGVVENGLELIARGGVPSLSGLGLI